MFARTVAAAAGEKHDLVGGVPLGRDQGTGGEEAGKTGNGQLDHHGIE
jgi:hypothetical protein